MSRSLHSRLRLLLLGPALGLLTIGPVLQSQQAPAPAAPEPNPDAHGIYHIADGVKPPHLVHSVDPHFTEEARRHSITGTTLLSFVIGTDGVPTDIIVVRSAGDISGDSTKRAIAAGLDAKAIEAVKQYRFKPGFFQGNPVPIRIRIETHFHSY